ncbi:site-specific DNA-methyltransferase [Azospirillum brasilense]|uniref:site-specific DNA-methyltransferase n=1 Tax=Azospirillum brasilense TaxID=192 RepID=UPI001EDB895B|nr:site-specific DNA-methyltransferase [Azospirillum brasilense]UKJ75927.1 site-specific DNA-methyltransferase [Azospirillum brasilense]
MDYSDLSREQLINLLVKRDARRKLGLVWERDEIEHDRALNTGFVVMDHRAEHSCGSAPYENLIIEGENFDALRWLRMTHAGRIKVIYIDPPYNTGNKDWVYNDHHVKEEDRFRHSMWLEWLYQRLSLARDLLTEDGVLLVSISDDNRARLELMMDEVFPGMRKGSLVWRSRIGGNDAGECHLSVNHEHVLVYAMPGFRFGGTKKDLGHYKNYDEGADDPWFADNLTVAVKYTDRRAGNAYYSLQDPETGIWYPCNPNGVWRFASKVFLKKGQRTKKAPVEDLIAQGKILFPKDERVQVWHTLDALLDAIDRLDVPFRGGVPILRRGLPDLEFWVGKPVGWGSPLYKRHRSELKSEYAPLSSWVRSKTDEHRDEGVTEISSLMGEEGTTLLNKMFGEKVFNYPKPLSLMKNLLAQVCGGNDLVLDFFAGSGTTAHAVLALNAEDDGRRRFILVSSCENSGDEPDRNLCRDVCAERVRRVAAELGGGDFAYLAARTLPFEDLAYELAPAQVWTAVQALHDLPFTPYDPDQPVHVAVSDQRELVAYCDRFTPEAEDRVRALAQGRTGFVYSWTPGSVREAFEGHRGLEIRAVPDLLVQGFRP